MFEDFNKITKKEWQDKATKDLKGEDVIEKFSWSAGTLNFMPYYDQEDLENRKDILTFGQRMAADDVTGLPRVWQNMFPVYVIDTKSANTLALQALNSGADGIHFHIQDEIDVEILMRDIMPQYCYLNFECNNVEIARTLQSYFNEKEFIGVNILTGDIENAGLLIKSNGGNLKSRHLLIKSHKQEVVEEVADIMRCCTEQINKHQDDGLAINQIIDSIYISIEVSKSYFEEIAKIRSIRILFFQMARAYGYSTFDPEDLNILCISTPWENEDYAPQSNLLKSSTAVLASILGGCNQLITMPADDSQLATRIALNTSTIIKEESYLNQVVDPCAGSYFIESMTDNIARKAWEKFSNEIDKAS